MNWECVLQLECPCCEQAITNITYSREFYLIAGRRSTGPWIWRTECCGAEFLDELYNWENQRDAEGEPWSALLHKHNGSALFVWKETRGIQEDV